MQRRDAAMDFDVIFNLLLDDHVMESRGMKALALMDQLSILPLIPDRQASTFPYR